MKRLLTILALGLGVMLQGCYQPVFAQTSNYGGISISGSYTTNCIPVAVTAVTLQCAALVDNGTVLTSTEALVLPASNSGGTSLTIQLSGNTSQGIYLHSTGGTGLIAGNNTTGWLNVATTAVAGVQIPLNGVYGISSSGTLGAAGSDVLLGRRTTANWRYGAADVNGVPVAQTLSVQNAITGSNLAGGTAFSLAASLGTGAGVPGTLVITGGDSSVASGTTAQTQITRASFNSTKALTTGAATTAVSIPLATLQMTGGTIDYYIEATDGTNQCTSKNSVQYAAENSAGVFKATVTKVIGTSVTNCTGATTLTEAWAMSSANPSLIQVTPTLTGITATRFTMIYEVHHMGNTVPTI